MIMAMVLKELGEYEGATVHLTVNREPYHATLVSASEGQFVLRLIVRAQVPDSQAQWEKVYPSIEVTRELAECMTPQGPRNILSTINLIRDGG